MAENQTFIPTEDVAALLGITATTFLRQRENLEAKHNFPPPMPQQQRPFLYRRSQVESWITAHGQHLAPDLSHLAGGKVVILQKAQAA